MAVDRLLLRRNAALGILPPVSVDTGELTRLWLHTWPQCPPIGHLFRTRMHDRWVRFHSLPNGRRPPGDEADYRETLHRYNAVLSVMLSESGSAAINLITPSYGAGDLASGTEPIHVGFHPGSVGWLRVVDEGTAHDLWVSRRQFGPGSLDGLFRYIADDRTSDVVITDSSLRWLMHPYDGGMDVIAPSAGRRDVLAARFREWLSDRADGL